jgi:hypothetical protein
MGVAHRNNFIGTIANLQNPVYATVSYTHNDLCCVKQNKRKEIMHCILYSASTHGIFITIIQNISPNSYVSSCPWS